MIPECAIPTLLRNSETGEWRVVGYRIPSPHRGHELDIHRVVAPTGKWLWKTVCLCGWSGNEAYKIGAVITQGINHHLGKIPPYCPHPKKAAFKTEVEANEALVKVWRKAPRSWCRGGRMSVSAGVGISHRRIAATTSWMRHECASWVGEVPGSTSARKRENQ